MTLSLSARLRQPAAASWALVSLLYLVVFVFPEGMPRGIYASGLVFGARSALLVIGLVLVYRSSRIINFAQLQIGIVGALAFYLLVQFHLVVRGLDGVCGCSPVDRPPGWPLQVEFWLSVAAGLLVSTLLSLAVYVLVVRRFRAAPPLVGTVATIAMASLLGWFTATQVPNWLQKTSLRGVGGALPPPFRYRFAFGDVLFGFPAVATVLVAVLALVGLSVFLRLARTGIAVRAAAENDERAAMLGVNSARVTAVVWAQAGLLAGLSGVLVVMSEGGTATSSAGPQSLVPVLAAIVIGGMVEPAAGGRRGRRVWPCSSKGSCGRSRTPAWSMRCCS